MQGCWLVEQGAVELRVQLHLRHLNFGAQLAVLVDDDEPGVW
jgi:hypothetical protein